MTTPRITQVLREQAELLDEKVPGYRAIAVKAVVDILQLQGAGHSDKGRRDRAGAVVDAAGQQVAAKRGSGS